MHVEIPGFNSFADLLETDPYFFSMLAKVRVGEKTEFLFQDGFLLRGIICAFQNVVYVFKSSKSRIVKVMWGKIGLCNWYRYLIFGRPFIKWWRGMCNM